MPESFKTSVITPEAIVLETMVSEAQIPAFDGLLGILDHRAPLLAKLTTGVLRLTTNSGTQKFLVTGGYAQMKNNQLTLLVSEAIPAAEITPATLAAEQAKLDALQTEGTTAMHQRQALQSRISAIRSLTNAAA